jgi:hypothetical protein
MHWNSVVFPIPVATILAPHHEKEPKGEERGKRGKIKREINK